MVDLFSCPSCGGTGEKMENISDLGSFDLAICYRCNGLGFTDGTGMTRTKPYQNNPQKVIQEAVKVIEATRQKRKVYGTT